MTTPKRRKPKGERKDQDIRIRISAEEKEAFNTAAEKAERTLSDWLRWIARRASGLTEGV